MLFLYQTYLAKFPPEPKEPEEEEPPPEKTESSALPTFGTQGDGDNTPTVQGAGVVANGDLADPSFQQRERSPEEVAQRDAVIADLFSRYGEPILARTAKRLDVRCCELKRFVLPSDLDASGTLNSSGELKQLTTNVLFRLSTDDPSRPARSNEEIQAAFFGMLMWFLRAVQRRNRN